ncbi:MAG: DUF427 domain-containing protein [Pseudomonadota bacterium]
MKAIWNHQVIAESDATIVIEGNHYFPPDSQHTEFFKPSTHTSICGWKGLANYYDVVVHGQSNANAAWTYREPKPEAESIRNYVAFWNGVEVVE